MANIRPYTTNAGAPPSSGTGAPDPPQDATQSDGTNLTGLDSASGDSGAFASGLSAVAPYLISGGLGLFEGNKAAGENKALEGKLTGLGQPLINQGQTLINRGNTGTLTPAEQNVVTTAQQQGQTLIDAASPLYKIASSSFSQYQAGQLQPWQQKQLDASTAAAKAQLQQQFGAMGISDSSQLIEQMNAIDQNAEITKGKIMADNLQVGDQQFAAWLTTTEEGQKIQMAGKQFAVSSLDKDLTTGLQFSQAGMEPIIQGVRLGIEQDTQLSGNIQQLMGSLATAYAKGSYNQKTGQGGGSTISAIGGALSKMFGGGSSGDPAAAARAGNAGAGTSISGGALDAQNQAWDSAQAAELQQQDMTSFDTQLANEQVDNSYFNDPMFTDIPTLDFGSTDG